jgi:hypothetical protein
MAMLHEAGDGVARDMVAARDWYARAAAAGEPAAQAELGGYYEEADGVRENWDLAAQLYAASAAQGWVKGQFALGRAYEFGIGVPQDRRRAVEWFERAAAQGHARARYFASWLRDPTNNIGFRDDREHDAVIQGRLRFALGSGDPAGIAFHDSGSRARWLQGEAAQLNVSEALVMWQLRKDEFDSCQRNGGSGCREPGRRPQ